MFNREYLLAGGALHDNPVPLSLPSARAISIFSVPHCAGTSQMREPAIPEKVPVGENDDLALGGASRRRGLLLADFAFARLGGAEGRADFRSQQNPPRRAFRAAAEGSSPLSSRFI
jgi:hypothetical protein